MIKSEGHPSSQEDGFVRPFPVSEELHADFPLLWEMAQNFDFAERLGGCTDPLHAEVDRALHELWMARMARRING